MLGKMLSFEIHGDDRGSLIALEESKQIPFPVKRVYYIFDTKLGVRRGFHAHRELKQILICVKGRCFIKLDNGRGTKEEVLLDSPSKGLLLQSNIWREMHDFSPDAVLLVLASMPYDESDYIRDYHQFLEEVSK